MTDFALCHEGTWRDGEAPKLSGATYVVHHDQRSRAYHIERFQFAEFLDWVAIQWEIDRDPRGDDEPAQDYLDRIGVTVREM
jgi:hypothetical protein